jgi:hypothetical protein
MKFIAHSFFVYPLRNFIKVNMRHCKHRFYNMYYCKEGFDFQRGSKPNVGFNYI